jgi:hypothetical protein
MIIQRGTVALLLFIIDLIANEKKCECGEGFGDS